MCRYILAHKYATDYKLRILYWLMLSLLDTLLNLRAGHVDDGLFVLRNSAVLGGIC